MTTTTMDNSGRLRFWLWVTAIVMGLALTGIVAGTLNSARQAERANEELTRQLDLNGRIRQMLAILIGLSEAEAGQRAFLLSGKAAFRQRYEAALAQLDVALAELETTRARVAGVDEQIGRIGELARLKRRQLAEAVELFEAGQPELARMLIEEDAGPGMMESARVAISSAVDAIRKDRDTTTRSLMASTAATRTATLWTIAALVVCLALAALQLLLLRAAQRRFAAALAESEARHRAIVEEQQDLISLARRDGTLVYLNPAYARHHGLTVEALVGRNLFDFVDGDDREAVQGLLDRVFATGEPHHGENRVVAQDGQVRWFAWTNTLQTAADGGRVLHSVGRDVTDRRLAEKALQASEAFLGRTGRVAGVGGWELDLRTDRLYWSDEVRRIHEVPEDYVPVVATAIGFYPPEARAEVAAAVEEGRCRPGVFDLELPFVTATGRELCVRVVGESQAEGEGPPVRLVGAMQDITERKRLERELADQTAALQAVLEAIPAMVAVLDDRFRYRLVNRAFEHWRGRPRSEVIGSSVAEVFGQDEHDRSWPWARRALDGETVNYEKQYAVATEQRHVSICYVPLRLANGAIGGLVAVAQDITSHRDRERRLLDLAERDALTGALNRVGLQRAIEQPQDEHSAGQMALLYVDLDRFKAVNDTHGHPVGDELLRLFTLRLMACVRPTDVVARLGGDEFAIVLRGVRRAEHASAVADKVVVTAQEPFRIGPLTLHVSASVGVSYGVDRDTGWQGLVARADAAVYQAKASGRGRAA